MSVNGRQQEHGFYFPPNKDAKQMNPLALAYMGDAVYEVFIRQYVISQPNQRPNHLHRGSTRYVSAKAQAKALERLMPLLSAEETEWVKRGRNAKSGSSPKNTDILVYRHSTAFECLLGWLYYTGQAGRMEQLMRLTLEEPGGAGDGAAAGEPEQEAGSDVVSIDGTPSQ